VPARPSGRNSAMIEIILMALEGLHYSDITTNIGRSILGHFNITNDRTVCEVSSATWEFGYQLSLCSKTEENHGKP
jgi:hypothetical protein